jgi:hypothetical protein
LDYVSLFRVCFAKRFRVFNSERTRVIIPASNGDFDQWSSALHSLLENHLDAADLEERRRLAKEVEPIYERHEEYQAILGFVLFDFFAS